MDDLTIFKYNSQSIERRDTDEYINLTQMCQANGKRLTHWLETNSTKAYIEAVSSEAGIPASDLIQVIRGNYSDGRQQGTWGHKLVAMHLAQWISPEFHVWCNKTLFAVIEGTQPRNIREQIELAKLDLEKLKVQDRQLERDFELKRLDMLIKAGFRPQGIKSKIAKSGKVLNDLDLSISLVPYKPQLTVEQQLDKLGEDFHNLAVEYFNLNNKAMPTPIPLRKFAGRRLNDGTKSRKMSALMVRQVYQHLQEKGKGEIIENGKKVSYFPFVHELNHN